MKFFEYLKPKQNSSSGQQAEAASADAAETDVSEENNEVSSATKVKIVAALLIVGFATYIAYWVQEPTQLRADVLAPGETMEASAPAENTAEVAQVAESGFTQEVSIVDFAFDPVTINVEKGTTVVWTNKDPVPHTVTGSTFSSGTLNAGDTFSYTFNQDGEFEYTCSFHPQMMAKVTVGVVATGTLEVAPTQELAPAAPEPAPPAEIITPDTEVILPDDATAVTYDAQALVTELTAPNLGVPLSRAAQEAAVLNAAAAEGDANLAKSGPEDLLYLALFGVILYFNRKRLKLAGLLK